MIENSSIKQINNIPVRYEAIDISESHKIADAIENHDVDILYIAPLRAFELDEIVFACQQCHSDELKWWDKKDLSAQVSFSFCQGFPDVFCQLKMFQGKLDFVSDTHTVWFMVLHIYVLDPDYHLNYTTTYAP